MTYSLDFRKNVLRVKTEEKLTYVERAFRFKIGKASLVRWNKELKPKRTRNKPATKIDMELLKADVFTYPDSYQYERTARLRVSKTGVYWALERLGVSYKKTLYHSKADAAKRLLFQERYNCYFLTTMLGV